MGKSCIIDLMKKPLILPKFKNEDEEPNFWAKINLADYYEPSDMQPVSFPNLKLTKHERKRVKSAE